ncbi:hypothetical protein N8462_01160, partial [bacterium]|nr:hypothetical protein [bacterium]
VGIGTLSPDSGLTIAKAQTSAHTYTTNHLHLATPATSNNGGATTISFATSTSDNYGWSLSAIREATNGNDTRFAFKSHNNSDSGSEVLSVLAEGSVGIGTVSPECKLDIHDHTSATTFIADNNAGVRITNWGGSTGWSLLGFGGFSSTYTKNLSQIGSLSTNSGTYLAFGTSNNYGTGITNQAMTIDPSGKVGIGTASPDAKLHIKAPDNSVPAEIRLEHNDGGTQTAKIVFDQTGQNKLVLSTQYQSSSDGNLIQFAPANNIAMTISGGTGSSKVGIGTVTPSSRLHIVSDTATGSIFEIDNIGGNQVLRVDQASTQTTLTMSDQNAADKIVLNASSLLGGSIFLSDTSANSYLSIVPALGTVFNESGAAVDFRIEGDTNANLFFVDGSTDRIGIGTASPTTRLQVKDSVDNSYESGLSVVRSADNATTWINVRGGATNFNNRNHAENAGLDYRWFQNGSEKMRLDTSGNVGIGTTDPGNHKLKVAGETHSTHFITGYDWTAKTGGLHIGNDGLTAGAVSFYNGSSSSANIYRDSNILYVGARGGVNTAGLAIIADGNVGIGTTNPQGALDLGNATGGKSIAWGGTSGTGHYTSIWSEYGTGSLVLAGGLKSSTTAADFIYPYTGTYGYAAIELDSWSDDGIKFYTAADAARTAGSVATKQERMRIDTSGNVGIGTVGPTEKLDVRGNV